MLRMGLVFSPNEAESGMQRKKPECIWIVQENLIKFVFKQAYFEKKYSFET